MRAMSNDDMNISERMLVFLHPAFTWLGRKFPKFARDESLPHMHASAMLTEHNWLYDFILPRFFKRVSIDEASVDRLRTEAKRSTIVYVASNLGHLEYGYFNELFKAAGLPLCRYNNAITLKRWMKFDDYIETILFQEAEISKYGRPVDYIANDMLTSIVAKGQCAMVKIPQSSLGDEVIFYTGPMRAITMLIDAQRQSERPISIVPIDFLWSRRPVSQKKSLTDILFGEKEDPGFIRKVVLFWRHFKRQTTASIGKPIDLKEFLGEHPGEKDETLAVKLRDLLTESLRTERMVMTGPPIRRRSWFINEVLSDEDLDREICRIAAQKGKEADAVRDLAGRYIKEIAADVDYTYMELLDKMLSATLGKLYENFDIDRQGLGRAKELMAKGPLVFVPNHVSHVDYLIISHILYDNGMTIPHIAAGINLGFWPLGHIFRKCGAYFIRRRFRENQLYKAVIETYIKVLIKEGYTQEFFIEGGRSRTGKLRKPRLGMLSILKRASAKAGVGEINFIPVTLTYDRVIEQKSMADESAGGKKVEEKASHLIRLTKYLKGRYRRHGSIYIRFGEPVPMKIYEDDRAYIELIASEICNRINGHIVATPISIASAALLLRAKRGVTVEEFESSARLLYEYLGFKGVEMSARFAGPFAKVMTTALTQLSRNRLLSVNMSTMGQYVLIDEQKRISLSFFKNSIAHFIIGAGVLCALMKANSNGHSAVDSDGIIVEYESAMNIIRHEFNLPESELGGMNAVNFMDFLKSKGALSFESEKRFTITKEGRTIIDEFAGHIRPYAQTLLIVITYVEGLAADEVSDKDMCMGAQKMGSDLFLLGRISHKESVNKFDIENAIYTAAAFGLITETRKADSDTDATFYRAAGDNPFAKNLKATLQKLL
jgi:glycerol-3-phosphate O-acyltransferase